MPMNNTGKDKTQILISSDLVRRADISGSETTDTSQLYCLFLLLGQSLGLPHREMP